MAQASGAKRRITYLAESTLGATPVVTTGTKELGFVESSLKATYETMTNDTIRAHGQSVGDERGNYSVAGDINAIFEADNQDDFLEAFLGGTWTSDVLKVGSVKRSFTICESFMDINEHRNFTGCVVDSFTLESVPNDYVRVTYGFLGCAETAMSATPLSATPTAPTANASMIKHVNGTIREGGVTMATVTALSMTATRESQGTNVLTSLGFYDITTGTFKIGGNLTVLFLDRTLYNKMRNDTTTSLEFTFTDGTNSYTFDLPRVKYTEGEIVGGAGPLTVSLPFSASYDATDATTITITKS